jgi:hypothetical protein
LNASCQENFASYLGGDFFLQSSQGSILQSQFEGSTALQLGGSVYMEASRLLFAGCSLSRSSAINGGLLYVSATSTLEAVDSSFTFSSAQLGALIYVTDRGIVRLSRSRLSNGLAYVSGGGVYCNLGSDIALSETEITECSAASGGGLCLLCSLKAESSRITQNSAALSGGAVLIDPYGSSSSRTSHSSSAVLLINTTIASNSGVNGGGVAVAASLGHVKSDLFFVPPFNISLLSCHFEENSGSAVYVGSGDLSSLTVTIGNSSFLNNLAEEGAAVFVDSSATVIQPCSASLTFSPMNSFNDLSSSSLASELYWARCTPSTAPADLSTLKQNQFLSQQLSNFSSRMWLLRS